MDYTEIIAFAKGAKTDYAHNFDHVKRVCRNALLIARGHPDADMDVLKTAVLLHDIGRTDVTRPHAAVGAELAEKWLTAGGYPACFAEKVSRVIAAHSDTDAARAAGIEGMILYDADKLEMTGAVGAIRAALYCEEAGLPMSAAAEQLAEDQQIAEAGFHTGEAKRMAAERMAFGNEIIKNLHIEIPEEELI